MQTCLANSTVAAKVFPWRNMQTGTDRTTQGHRAVHSPDTTATSNQVVARGLIQRG